jgi:hypothetical protein
MWEEIKEKKPELMKELKYRTLAFSPIMQSVSSNGNTKAQIKQRLSLSMEQLPF